MRVSSSSLTWDSTRLENIEEWVDEAQNEPNSLNISTRQWTVLFSNDERRRIIFSLGRSESKFDLLVSCQRSSFTVASYSSSWLANNCYIRSSPTADFTDLQKGRHLTVDVHGLWNDESINRCCMRRIVIKLSRVTSV
jgi:hypothetical protein